MVYRWKTSQPTDQQRDDSGRKECFVCWTVDPSHSCWKPQAAEGAVAATVVAETAENPAEAGAAATAAVEVEVDVVVEAVAVQEMDFRADASSSEWSRSPYRREPTAGHYCPEQDGSGSCMTPDAQQGHQN